MSEEYSDCGQDIGRPEEVFEIRRKTIPESADMMRIAGEKLAQQLMNVMENPYIHQQSGWAHSASTAIHAWNEAHEVFVEAMAREDK